jgi:uncharacterized protein (TIGR02246 family)
MGVRQARSGARSLTSRAAPRPHRTSPHAAILAFAEALSAAELEQATSLFADDGCFVTPDATAVRGRRGIREVLAQLTAGRVQLRVTPGTVQIAGSMALCSERWAFTYAGKDICPFTRVSDSTALLRRSDGGWQLSLVAPWHIMHLDRYRSPSTPLLGQGPALRR